MLKTEFLALLKDPEIRGEIIEIVKRANAETKVTFLVNGKQIADYLYQTSRKGEKIIHSRGISGV